MKKILVVLFIYFSIIGIAQEPIYNLNRYNLHLFNYAFYTYSDNRIAIDNSFEKYSSNRYINSSNILFSARLDFKLYASLNIKHHYLGAENSISGFDGVITYYIRSKHNNFIFAGNVGMINNSINFNTLETPYNFNNIPTTDFNSFNENNLNLGLSAIFLASNFIVGVSANHLNTPKLPYGDDKLPIKYTTFIRAPIKIKGIHKGRIVGTMIYQYQKAFLYNPLNLNYYFDMLNYLGLNLEASYYSWTFGLGYKLLSNNNNIMSAQLAYGHGLLRFSYSFSYMNTIDKNDYGLFHQIGINVLFKNRKSRGKIFRSPDSY